MSAVASIAISSVTWRNQRNANAATDATSAAVREEEAVRTLNDGALFPVASFGLQVYSDEKAATLTQLALDCGYKNFFASVLAGNQRGFARGVARSGIAREDIYVCGSVLSNSARGFDNAYNLTRRGIQENERALGADSIDMLMLDYPGPTCESIRGQWRALVRTAVPDGEFTVQRIDRQRPHVRLTDIDGWRIPYPPLPPTKKT